MVTDIRNVYTKFLGQRRQDLFTRLHKSYIGRSFW